MISIKDAEEILKHEYHLDNFTYLVKDILLPDFISSKHEVMFNNSIFEKVAQLGESSECNVSVFEVYLKEDAKNKRVAITQEMFKILRSLRIDNALVSFVNPDKKNYRISLLTSKYEYDGDKIIRIVSNPRRFSYSLGFGTKTKTAYQFLIAKGKVQSLQELVERFSVDIVNREFYNEIAICYSKLVGGERYGKKYEKQLGLYSVVDSKKYAEFAVRLIGRIMFCWFLKEKKSKQNNISLIPDNILSSTTISSQNSYYHNVLEPLFFELLNTTQTRRKEKYQNAPYNQIPYLNGGLFSPHRDDMYEYDRTTGYGRYGLVNIPNEWFLDFFKVLSQYNFTVDENTSYDIELSIDPEMLGRIFENLLAEINPETGENAKKSTGSFYTPRDIVDYMVDTSLCEYLKNKTNIDKLRLKALISYGKEDDDIAVFNDTEKKNIIDALYTITVLDPACGSGAFPIGMLQKIVYILQEIDPGADLWFDKATENVSYLLKKEFEKKFNSGSLNYIRKLSVIQNSIFGVDIQPIAVEISRLRCFLSLVIEENVSDVEENRGINPLPNLDFKFVIANSLIKLSNDVQMSLFEDQMQMDKLKRVREEYFAVNDVADKKDLMIKFQDIQKDMLMDTVTKGYFSSEKYQQLFSWKPFDNEGTSWFDSDWMFGIKDGFDIVIGNPPYIDSENMVNNGLKDERDYINKHYKFTKGNWDIYIAFFELGLSMLNSDGNMIYITPDKWISKPFGEKLRISNIDKIVSILNAGRNVFETALVDSIVTQLSNKPQKQIVVNKVINKKVVFDKIVDKDIFKDSNRLDIIFSNSIDLIKKIELGSVKLSTLYICENACATSDCYKLKEFIEELPSKDEFTDKYLKIINTGTIDKYVSRWESFDMKYLKDKYCLPVVNKQRFFEEFHNTYSQKSIKPKIIIKGLTLLDNCIDLYGEIIPGKSTMIIPADPEDLYFLSGFINSQLAIYYIKQKYASSSYNGGINFTKEMINSLPLKISDDDRKKISTIVANIYNSKTKDLSYDFAEQEKEINRIIFKNYSLTSEEIEIIESLEQ